MKTLCLTLAFFAVFALASAGHKKEDMFKLIAIGKGMKNLQQEDHKHYDHGHGYHGYGSETMMSPYAMPPMAPAGNMMSPMFMPPMSYMQPTSYYSPASSYMRPVIYQPYPSYVPVSAGSQMLYGGASALYPYSQTSQ